MSDILNALWELSTIPAALAGLVLLWLTVARLSPRMPGPHRDLKVEVLFVVWPADRPTIRNSPWVHALPFMALAAIVAVPGALWWLTQSDNAAGNQRLAWVLGVGLLLYFVVAWVEWTMRLAAWKRQPAFVLLVPATLLGLYALICRVLGASVVDRALLHGVLSTVGFKITMVIIAAVSAVLVGASLFGLGLMMVTAQTGWTALRVLVEKSSRTLRR